MQSTQSALQPLLSHESLDSTHPKFKMNFKCPPAVKRGGEFIGSLAVGALGGYIGYWMTRLLIKLGAAGEIGAVIHPLPYVLSGIASAAIVEVARLSHDAALYVLGRREKYEDLVNPEDASAFDRLRQRSWKVIARVEQLNDDIDVIFSRVFGIRSTKEIRNKNIVDQDLYFMEITRRAFWEQVHETITTAVPQELGVCAIEAMGYTIITGHLFVWLHGAVFFNGLVTKIAQVYAKVENQEREEIKRRKQDAGDKAEAERGAENEASVDGVVIIESDELANPESTDNKKANEDNSDIQQMDYRRSSFLNRQNIEPITRS